MVFYKGELVKIQAEGESITVDSIVKGLGIGSLPDDAKIKDGGTVIDIALDPTFTDGNIYRFPFELD